MRRRSVRASGPSTASTRRTSMRSTGRRRRRPPERRRVAVKRPQTIHLAHSPDADDAFMFWALGLYQRAARHVVVPFDQIEEYVAAGRADAGLLIHEGQLTYADRGLHLWVDLGEWWHGETGLPLPLGGNVVRRDLGDALMRDIARDLKASIQYGLAHRAEALAHATAYGRGLDPSRIDRFVGMYVNAYTVDYGPIGRQAVTELLARARRAGLLPGPVEVSFVEA